MASEILESSGAIRILIGVGVAIFAVISYFGSSQFNEVTGENQHISMTRQQEIALGQQAAPELIQQFGGLSPDRALQDRIDRIGQRVVRQSVANDTEWEFEFHVLDDPQTINAFALPGGQIFITTAMLNQLQTDDEIAAVLAHEIVHVLARHSAERVAKSELTSGLVGAIAVASGEASAAKTAQMIGQLINMQYGRDDEIESDTLGTCLMRDAGYDPAAMINLMEVLEQASAGNRPPEFFSTHPSPDNRIGEIQEALRNPGDCPS